MPARKTDKTSKPAGQKPAKRTAAKGKAATTLPESMVTGKASPAKAAVGDKPVFAYIASLPQPQRGIAERVDALAARTLPGLQRSVKWGMSYYGVGDGWCFCCGGFADHVKLMFVNGAALDPVPPVTPVAMGKSTRGVELTVRGRPRRTPDRGMDETSRGRARCRGEEAVGPKMDVDGVAARRGTGSEYTPCHARYANPDDAHGPAMDAGCQWPIGRSPQRPAQSADNGRCCRRVGWGSGWRPSGGCRHY